MDFNEDFSAFHAPTLREQATYVSQAANRVLAEYLYEGQKVRPERVTLLAHSMGGIVARLAVTMDIHNLVDIIFTMSTPHLFPPVAFEYGMEAVYQSITFKHNDTWPLLFSVCGGISDSQIVSDACALSSESISNNNGFAVFSSGVPGVWTGIDHQAMVWCHQMRWRVARLLLDTTRFTDRQGQLTAAQRWLLGSKTTDVTGSMTQIIPHTLPVTSKHMTVLYRPTFPTFAFDAPRIHLNHCNALNICSEVIGTVDAFPSPLNDSDPFPFVGEGIKPQEIAFAYSFPLSVTDGFLNVDTDGTEIIIGPWVEQEIRGSTWCEPRLIRNPLTYQLQLFLQC